MIQTLAAAVVAAFVFGGVSGALTVHRWYRVDALNAQVRKLKEDQQRFRTALQLGERIDDDDKVVETKNDDIQRALEAYARDRAPAPPANVDHTTVCVDRGWLLQLGAFK